MMKNEYLDTFHIKLTVLSPLHIGSGQVIQKRNYYFDSRTKSVTFYNMERLLSILASRGKADVYEEYVFSAGYPSLKDLFFKCRMTAEDFSPAELCTVSTAGVLDKEHSLKDIQQFVRTADYRPYVPGSSLKGALRTILLHQLIKKGTYTEASFDSNPKTRASKIEDQLLGTLPFSKAPTPSNAPLRSVMRGLSVSDSEPLDNSCIILAGKYDTDGVNPENCINVVRECIRPGTVIRFAVSIDRSILDLSSADLRNAASSYFEYYQDTYLPRFSEDGFATLPAQDGCCLLLGGGNGYFSKTITYKALGYNNALKYVSDYLQSIKKFREHGHDKDRDFGISPHMLKCTDYMGSLVQIGWCRLETVNDQTL